MKIIINLFAFIFINSIISQNLLKGKVIDNLKRPLVGVNILLKGTNKGVDTDLDGNFKIDNISGKQTLIITSVGYKTREVAVEAPNKNIIITLYEGNELLQEVEIVSRNNTFSRKSTAYVSKLPLKDIENSQVYTTVTNELLESQIAINFDDALKNATGVNKLWEATGRSSGEGTGFYSIRGFATQPNLVDGVAGYTFSTLDPSYIERIEVIKGPSATLLGSTGKYNIGGQINIVTKKPHQGTGGSINFTGGSFDTYRASVDYNTPLAGKNSPYFRINASYLDKGTWQDAGFTKTFFIAPSLSYRVNNRLNFQLGLEFSKTKQTNPPMLFLRRGKIIAKNIDELKLNHNKSFTSNDVYLTTPSFNSRLITDYKISDQWNSQTVFATSYTEVNGYYQYLIDGGAQLVGLLANGIYENKKIKPYLPVIKPFIDPIFSPMLNEAKTMLNQTLFTRVFNKRDANSTRFNIQQNFTGDFKIGELRNRLVIGLDYVNTDKIFKTKSGNSKLLTTSGFSKLLAVFKANPLTEPIAKGLIDNISNTPYFDAFLTPQGDIYKTSLVPNAIYSPNKKQLDSYFQNIEPLNDTYNSQTLAAYFSNVLNFSPTLSISFGARIDHFIQSGLKSLDKDDYNKTAFSPRAGFVYQPILNKLSIFVNYQTGFVNIDPQFSRVKNQVTRIFDPAKSQQLEGGVKTNLFNSKLNIGASYYYITVNNKLVSEPNSRDLQLKRIPIEEITSKGLEFELNTNPVKGLNIRGSYAYNDTKITDATTPAFNGKEAYVIKSYEDKRTEESGPKAIYNLWADYRFEEETILKGFGIGAGLNGASDFVTINNLGVNKFTIPAYTIYNASLYYNTDKFRIGIKANNITDKLYYTGWSTVNPQAPRSFLGTVTYKL